MFELEFEEESECKKRKKIYEVGVMCALGGSCEHIGYVHADSEHAAAEKLGLSKFHGAPFMFKDMYLETDRIPRIQAAYAGDDFQVSYLVPCFKIIPATMVTFETLAMIRG